MTTQEGTDVVAARQALHAAAHVLADAVADLEGERHRLIVLGRWRSVNNNEVAAHRASIDQLEARKAEADQAVSSARAALTVLIGPEAW